MLGAQIPSPIPKGDQNSSTHNNVIKPYTHNNVMVQKTMTTLQGCSTKFSGCK